MLCRQLVSLGRRSTVPRMHSGSAQVTTSWLNMVSMLAIVVGGALALSACHPNSDRELRLYQRAALREAQAMHAQYGAQWTAALEALVDEDEASIIYVATRNAAGEFIDIDPALVTHWNATRAQLVPLRTSERADDLVLILEPTQPRDNGFVELPVQARIDGRVQRATMVIAPDDNGAWSVLSQEGHIGRGPAP